MKERWRLIPFSLGDPYENMAVDEAIAVAVGAGASPCTLRFYGWDPPAVSIGYFQDPREEVDVAACERLGVRVVRRVTGGGAVYHDTLGELTYSVSVPLGHRLAADDVLASYELICGALARGLAKLGVDAEFKPVNDIVVGGRKVSGNAQTRRHGALLQHGTVLLDVDFERMFAVLKVPSEKLRDKAISQARERVTSLRHALGRPVAAEEVARALAQSFSESFGVSFEVSGLSGVERKLAAILTRKYSSDEWLFGAVDPVREEVAEVASSLRR